MATRPPPAAPEPTSPWARTAKAQGEPGPGSSGPDVPAREEANDDMVGPAFSRSSMKLSLVRNTKYETLTSPHPEDACGVGFRIHDACRQLLQRCGLLQCLKTPTCQQIHQAPGRTPSQARLSAAGTRLTRRRRPPDAPPWKTPPSKPLNAFCTLTDGLSST